MKIHFYLFIFLNIEILSYNLNPRNKNKIKDLEDLKFLEYIFKRNLTIKESIKPEEFFKNYFYNQLYINIKVGSNQQEIPFYFYLQQFPLIIQSSNVSESQVKGIYNESNSTSYTYIRTETFTLGDLSEGFFSMDNFYFNINNNNTLESLLKFYLSKENNDDSHITEGGKIGFKPYSFYSESDDSSFLANLKKNNIISSSIFSFKYDNSKTIDIDSGKLYIGAHPYQINKAKYKQEYYLNYGAENGFSGIDWIYYFDDIFIDNKIIEKRMNGYFYSEIGFIVGTINFFDHLENLENWKEYLYNNKKCYKQNFKIKDFDYNDYFQTFTSDLTGYYCDKDVNIEKLNFEISFLKREINYAFNFTYKDLWIEKNGYKYFMIIKLEFNDDTWYFGKPFFKKYQMVFEYDNKQIGVYTNIFEENEEDKVDKNNNKNNTLKYGLIIGGLIIIIIGLTGFLIKCYLDSPRKKRANELLDDNYEYSNEKINE